MNRIFTFRNFVYALIAVSSVIVVSYIAFGIYHIIQHSYFDLFFDILCIAMNTWCVTVQLQSLKYDKLSKELKQTLEN